MKTLYLGTYTEPIAFGFSPPDQGVQLYLHCLDPNTYVISDNVDGRFFADVPIPAAVGKKVMDGDLNALMDTRPEIAAFVNRPHFKPAAFLAVCETDVSLLRTPQLKERGLRRPGR